MRLYIGRVSNGDHGHDHAISVGADRRLLGGALALIVAFMLGEVVVGWWAGSLALLSRANRRSLNVEGAFQHILTDLFAFIATAVAGVIMLVTGFDRADGIATLVVVALMVRAGIKLVRESGRIFLEAAPADLDIAALGDRLAAVAGVAEIHDLHVWTITSGQPALSAHVLVDPGSDCHDARRRMERLLRDDYRIAHTTLQVDHADRAASAAEPYCAEAHGPIHRASRSTSY